ncbi:MAG TPA: hypothetical protein VFJ16_22810 [Longimicrobium sp.]|nr:hypothetical protein [Longimicrobium sp.]
MFRLRILILPTLLFAAACGPDQTTRTASATPAPETVDTIVVLRKPEPRVIPDSVAGAEPPVAPLPPAPAYLVWTADSAHPAVTAWIDSTGREVARRRGVYLAAGGRLWRWVDGTKPSQGIRCDCTDEHSVTECSVTEPVGVADLAEVGGPARVPVLEILDTSRLVRPPKQRGWPEAGAGRYLFASYWLAWDGCGAHGGEGFGHQLVDLERQRLLDTDTVRYTARDSAAALDTMAATDWGDPDGVDDPGLRDMEAEWAGDSVRVLLRFALGAPFGMGDGDGYARTERIIARHPPRWLAPYLQTPEAVRRRWRTSPRREHAGWTAVDRAHASALLARFRAR